jgi:hypothetical protein
LQLLRSAELRFVVAALTERLKLFQPQILEDRQLSACVKSGTVERLELIYYFEGKVVGPEFIPVRLERFVRMTSILQLESVAVDQPLKIAAGAEEHLVAEVVPYEENTHRPRVLLVILLKSFVVFFHFVDLTAMDQTLGSPAFAVGLLTVGAATSICPTNTKRFQLE